MTLYGYIRTSRRQVEGMPGSDPETQQLQLRTAGVSLENIYRDVGVSGETGTNTRNGWRALNARLGESDILVGGRRGPHRKDMDRHCRSP